MRIALVLSLLMFVGTLPAAAAPPNAPADPSVARIAGLNGTAFDIAFMQAVIPVDDEAVEMAMTATLYADHPALLHWNQSIVERKSDQIRKLLAWLQAAGVGPAERRAGVATESVKKLRSLRDAALERAYLTMMPKQLDKVAALARLAAVKAQRPELREFAKETVRVENQDSATLRGWMKQWYAAAVAR